MNTTKKLSTIINDFSAIIDGISFELGSDNNYIKSLTKLEKDINSFKKDTESTIENVANDINHN